MSEPLTASDRSPAWQKRQAFWDGDETAFDVLIIGGGAQGACLFHRLTAAGHRVLIVDRGDFGSGTSQASAMLVWGGLLYLKQLDLREVVRLCAARDRLIGGQGRRVGTRNVSLLFGDHPHRKPWMVWAALHLYRAAVMGRRGSAAWSGPLRELTFLNPASARRHVRFEEGYVVGSDARFVFDWVRHADNSHEPDTHSVAMNYCQATSGYFDNATGLWTIKLAGKLEERSRVVTARHVVNAAGIWADAVNARFGEQAPWQHLFAKGASITVARPADHHDTLVFDGRGERGGMSLVPWGPVSVWGSTETIVASPEAGRHVDVRDVDFLLGSLNRHVKEPRGRGDVVALRCGVRPLVVRRGRSTEGRDPLTMSKRSEIWHNAPRHWLTIFGGKLTRCEQVTDRVVASLHAGGLPARGLRLANVLIDRQRIPEAPDPAPVAAQDGMRTAEWSREHEMCWTLDDYLRRRTNLAQWVPRAGLGRWGEHRASLLEAAGAFVATTGKSVSEQLVAYENRVEREDDSVLGVMPVQKVRS